MQSSKSPTKSEEPCIEDVEPTTQKQPTWDASALSGQKPDDTDQGVIVEEGVRKMDNGTLIIRDKAKISSYFDNQNVLRGFKTATEQMDQAEPSPDTGFKELKIPPDIFENCQEINEDNDELFRFSIIQILMTYAREVLLAPYEQDEAREVDKEKLESSLKVCLVFPDIVPSDGRPIIHDIASSFRLAHHSGGSKKSRKVYVYPKTLFIEKQKQEKARLEKERRKLSEKYTSVSTFRREPHADPTAFTDKVIRDLWEERVENLPVEKRTNHAQEVLDNIESSCGEKPDPIFLRVVINEQEKEMATLLTVMKNKAVKLDERTGKLAQMEEERKDAVAKMKQKKKEERERKKNNNELTDSDNEPSEEEESEEELDEETLERIKQAREANARLIRDFDQKLETTNLQSFQDKPEAVEQIFVDSVGDEWAEIAWDAPDSNNSEITGYNIYIHQTYQAPYNSVDISEKIFEWEGATPQGGWVKIGTTKNRTFQAQGLEQLAVYKVMVRAENKHGEGYLTKKPSQLMTLSKRSNNPCDLYVWGSNTYSELGLNEDQVTQNKAAYFSNSKKAMMQQVIKQDSFSENVYQVAASSATTIVAICHERNMTVVQMGVADILKEEFEEDPQCVDKNIFLYDEKEKYIDRIPAMPFGVDFQISVAKIAAGAGFAALLSVEGHVYTWGSNQFGELGIDKTEVALQVRPGEALNFIQHKEKSFPASQQTKMPIIDLVCGDSFAVALSANREVFVWGRRMGIYPKVELNFDYLRRFNQAFMNDINQACPRQVTNNITFYKVQKLYAGPMNAALITEDGDVLVQGFNDCNQIMLSASTYDRERISNSLFFMPEFMKIDFFTDYRVKQVAIANSTIHVLSEHKGSGKQKIFGWGSNEYLQLGPGDTNINGVPTKVLEPKELTQLFFPEEQETIQNEEEETENLDVIFDEQKIRQIAAGKFHTLVLDKTSKLQGVGQTSRGQFAKKFPKEQKCKGEPTSVDMVIGKGQTLKEIVCGGQYNMALVGKAEEE